MTNNVTLSSINNKNSISSTLLTNIKSTQNIRSSCHFDDIPIKSQNSNFIELLEKNLESMTPEQLQNEEKLMKEKGVRRHTPTKIKKKNIQISKPTKEEKKYHYYNHENVMQGEKERKKSPSPGHQNQNSERVTGVPNLNLAKKKDKKMQLRSNNEINNLSKVTSARPKSIEKNIKDKDKEKDNNSSTNITKKPKKPEVM